MARRAQRAECEQGKGHPSRFRCSRATEIRTRKTLHDFPAQYPENTPMSLLPVSREVEDVCVSSAAEPTNNMKTNRKSTVKHSNRLAAYLATGIGAGLVATPAADAAIVLIDITSFGLDGPNAGVSSGSSTPKPNFPISGGGTLLAANSFLGMGFYGQNNLYFAAGSSVASPVNFALNPKPAIEKSRFAREG